MLIQSGIEIGRYRILEFLGEGGMARVFSAYDSRLEIHAAVKFIRMEDIPSHQIERTIERFRVEARRMARLSHSNIVPVTDYGEFEGIPYLVMPLIAGGSLKNRLGRPVAWRDAARLIAPIADALAYTHSKDIIHRDVKPSNILLNDNNEALLTDFGIAKIVDASEARQLTLTGSIVGTPEYMAPEQYVSTQFDHRVDIYSLGIVLYELITGRKPFEADTPSAVMIKHARDPLPDPRSYVTGLPEMAVSMLYILLAKKPEERFIGMRELASVLRDEGLAASGDKLPVEKKRVIPERKKSSLELNKSLESHKKIISLQNSAAEDEKRASRTRQESKGNHVEKKAAKISSEALEEKSSKLLSPNEKPRKQADEGTPAKSEKDKFRDLNLKKIIGGTIAVAAAVLAGVLLFANDFRLFDNLNISLTQTATETLEPVEKTAETPVAEKAELTATPDAPLTKNPAMLTSLPEGALAWQGIPPNVPSDENIPYWIIGSQLIYQPEIGSTIDIFFNDLPEYLSELNRKDWVIEISIDSDGDRIDDPEGANSKDNGVEYIILMMDFLTAGNGSDNLTEGRWNFQQLMRYDAGCDCYQLMSMVEVRFLPDEDKLVINTDIPEMTEKANITLVSGFSELNNKDAEVIEMELRDDLLSQNVAAEPPAFSGASGPWKEWNITAAPDKEMEAVVDLVGGVARLTGKTLEITLQLRDVPETLLINRESIADSTADYMWDVQIDIERDGQDDYEMAVVNWKFDEESPGEVNMEGAPVWAEAIMFFWDDETKRFDIEKNIRAEFSPGLDILKMTVEHQDFSDLMILRVTTSDGIKMGDLARFE